MGNQTNTSYASPIQIEDDYAYSEKTKVKAKRSWKIFKSRKSNSMTLSQEIEEITQKEEEKEEGILVVAPDPINLPDPVILTGLNDSKSDDSNSSQAQEVADERNVED